MNRCIRIFLCVLVCAVQLASARAADWYVDNVKGIDASGDGSEAKPFQTIARAFKGTSASDTIYLTPNIVPYAEKIKFPVGGTEGKPFIFDGRGSVINMLTHYTADKWKDEGAGIYSMPLPNNAHVMDKQWQGFDLVFFDGLAGENCSSREKLEPLGYFLFKQRLQIEGKFHPLHNMLYIRLPEGKTPSNIKVEAPGVGTILHCAKPYVIIRNLTAMYCTEDGFATTGPASGIVFERVRGCYNMDQGISHHGSEVTVRNSRFDHNAGCGIVDVYPECKTKYIDCLIEDDSYRGGVEFHSGEYEMENCVIRNNIGKALSVNRNAKVKLSNCVFISKEKKYPGIIVGEGQLFMKNCTVNNFNEGLSIWFWENDIGVEVLNCAFIGNHVNYSWGNLKKEGIAKVNLHFDYNFLTPSTIKAYGKSYKTEQWEDFRKETNLDLHSLMKDYDGECPTYKTGLEIEGKKIGAEIDLRKTN